MFKTWWLRFPIVTFAVLAAAFSVYYLFYVRDKQEYLIERSFRLLGAMSERVEDQLLASRRVVKNAPYPAEEKGPGQPADGAQTSETLEERKKKFAEALKLAEPPLEAVPSTDQGSPGKKAVRNGDLPVLTERLTDGSEWFYFQYGIARARAKVEEVIGPVLELEGFDKLLFASSNGRVLFQQGQQDMRLVTLSGLRKKDGSSVDILELGRSSHLLDVEVAGRAYKLFVQPCSITRDESEVKFPSMPDQPATPAGKDEKKEPPPPDQQVWLLCGLKSVDGLRMEAASISASLATILVALSVLIAFSFPFLKLICIGPEERLRAIDGLLAALCGFLGISFLTILLLDALAFKNLAADSRKQLADLSEKLAENFSSELDEAYLQLNEFNRKALGEEKASDEFWETGDLLAKGVLHYKNFYTFVWVNDAGEQILRRSILPRPHPSVLVANRQYFKNALREHLWTRCIKEKRARFWLEPVRIATTGQNLAVLSIPAVSDGKFVLPGGPPCQDDEFSKLVPPKFVPKDMKDSEPKVATLSSFMISVNRPVLPPGFGFAVVDSEGKVLFHSNPRRALHENLLAETDSDRALRAYLFARRKGFVSSRYAGREHLFHVTPVPYVPLSVVAFRDKTVLRTVNTEILLTTLTCLIAYALLFIVLFSAVYLIPAFRARWIWPDRSRIVAYRQLTMVYAGFLLLAAPLLLKFLDASHSLWMGMLIPLFFLAVSYVRVRMDTASPPFDGRLLGVLIFGIAVFILVLVYAGDLPTLERSIFITGLVLCLAILFVPQARSWFEPKNAVSPRFAYLLTGALLLAILSIFPALMFFNVAFQLQTENFIKHGQARLAEALKEREERVRFQYRKISGAEEHLKERLALAQADVYANSFYKTIEYQCNDKCHLAKALDHSWLPAFFEGLLPLYNDTSVEVAKLAKDKEDAMGRWWRHWDDTPGARKLVLHGTGFGRAEAIHLESDLPNQFREVRANLWWLLPGLLLLAGTVWGTVSFIARRLLLLRMEAPPWMRDPNPQDPAIGSNTFYVLLPGDGAPPLTTSPGVETIDLAAPPRDLRSETESVRIRDAKIVHLAHFEHKLKDRPYTLQKLALLEDLVRSGKRVVVSSEADPHFELTFGSLRDNGFGGRETEARWKSLLEGFAVRHCSSGFGEELRKIREEKKRTEPERDFRRRITRNLDTIQRECCPSVHLQKIGLELARADLRSWDRAQLLDEILDRTDEHYRLLWQTLSPEEKLAVVQLAEEGLVNPNNRRALRKLILRGLVVRNPALQPMNETFRRFVTTGLEYAEVTRMEKEDRESAWVRLQRPLLTVLVGVAMFFFITQRETFDLTLLFITTLAAALPQLLKLVNYLGARMAEGEQP